jgi:hypothetical protein
MAKQTYQERIVASFGDQNSIQDKNLEPIKIISLLESIVNLSVSYDKRDILDTESSENTIANTFSEKFIVTENKSKES